MDISKSLSQLETAGLVRPGRRDPDMEYLFRHVLSQEAAYNSLLKNDRRGLHLSVGECLEREAGANPGELAPMLAMHFEQAGDDARALKYLVSAADDAVRRYANAEALAFYERALNIARRIAPDAAVTDLALKRGRLLEITGNYPGALAGYEALRAEAERKGDRAMRLRAELARATVLAAPTAVFNADEGGKAVAGVLALSRELGDREAEARSLWLDLLRNKFTQDIPRALDSGERAIALARDLGLKELLAYALNDIAVMYLVTGAADKATSITAEAVALFRELDNRNLLVDALTNQGEMLLFEGDTDGAVATLGEANDIATAIGNLWGQAYSNSIYGSALAVRGDVDKGLSRLRQSIEQARQAGFATGEVMSRAQVAFVLSELGDQDSASAIASEGLAEAERLIPTWRGQPCAMLALAAIRRGQVETADQLMVEFRPLATPYDVSIMYLGLCEAEHAMLRGDFAGAIAAADEHRRMLRLYNFSLLSPNLLICRALAESAQGRADAAAATLDECIAECDRYGMRQPRWRALCELWALQEMAGRADPSTLARARADLDYIAARIDDDALRSRFMALPAVRRIADATA